MQLKSILATALTLITAIQALPLERREILSFNGVTYTARKSDGSCQSLAEVTGDVKLMKSSGVHQIRTYSQECDILPNLLESIKSVGGGMTVVAAVWIDGTSNDDLEIANLKKVLNTHGTGSISSILVGNEVIFSGRMSASELAGKVKTVKAISQGIPVGSCEVDSTYFPELMAVSDIVSVNIHPYFSGVDVKGAVENVQLRYEKVVKAAGGKQVIIGETGWPSEGGSNDKAVASVANEKEFAHAISATSLPYFFFEWMDSSWKGSGSNEGHFGIFNFRAEYKL